MKMCSKKNSLTVTLSDTSARGDWVETPGKDWDDHELDLPSLSHTVWCRVVQDLTVWPVTLTGRGSVLSKVDLKVLC